jgi:hypothetical protein
LRDASRGARARRALRVVGLLLVGGAAVGLVRLNAFGGPLRAAELLDATPPPVVDEHFALARAHAPWLYHAVHPEHGRQDLPAAVDFDGDLSGENSWDNMPYHALVPTVYYATLETETHWFLTYHLYHPRDWTLFDVGLHLTHEGDGENLQVVVEKASGRPVLLFTQAHYRGGVYFGSRGGFADGAESARGTLVLVDDAGRPDPNGAHPAVYVQSRGHGLYGLDGDHACVTLAPDGEAVFDGHGLVFRPAREGEVAREPALDAAGPVPYRLESTLAKLWPGVRDGSAIGSERLFDGPVRYADERVTVDLPRFHAGERFSGPLGPDRGISPFAVDFGWRAGTLGALFFDPARRYAEVLSTPPAWSRTYRGYPFQGR